MTREEAIKLFRRDIECLSHDKCSDCILEEACDPMKTPSDSEYIAAYGMAIEALSTSEIPNNCEDAISRQALLDGIDNYIEKAQSTSAKDDFISFEELVVKALPPVTPKQKMGRWLAVENEDMETVGYYCSECDLPLETEERTPFCPNCGAKMAESEDTDGK